MNQGCPNEGPDHRILGPLTCFLERHLSFFSGREPMGLMLAFPCFVCVNLWWPGGRYLVLRAGFRYDVNWINPKTGRPGGYIFPEAAIKVLDHAMWY